MMPVTPFSLVKLWLANFTFTPWQLTYGMRNVNKDSDQKGEELFISNYPLFIEQKDELRLFAEDGILYEKS